MDKYNVENWSKYWKNIIFIIFLIVFLLLSFLFFGKYVDNDEYKEIDENKNIDYADNESDNELEFIYVEIDDKLKCENITNSYEKNNCLLEAKTCDNDSCFQQKALTFGEEAFCNEIKDENMKLGCSVVLQRSDIIAQAVNEDNINVCFDLPDEPNRVYCQDNFYNSKRFNENDLSLCSKIVNLELKGICEGKK